MLERLLEERLLEERLLVVEMIHRPNNPHAD